MIGRRNVRPEADNIKTTTCGVLIEHRNAFMLRHQGLLLRALEAAERVTGWMPHFDRGRSIVLAGVLSSGDPEEERGPMSQKAFTPAELNQGFVVAIQIVAKPGEENIVADALQSLIQPTMAEPGVKLFLPYRSPTDPTSFFIFELYQDEAGWAEHQKTAHFKSFADNLLPRIAKRERIPFVPYASIA